jgi:hypothetical protein
VRTFSNTSNTVSKVGRFADRVKRMNRTLKKTLSIVDDSACDSEADFWRRVAGNI